jgi:Spy/CpxP family protein refolding chaperone
MKAFKWLGITAAAGLCLGGLVVVKAHAAGARLARGAGAPAQQRLMDRAAERLGLSPDQTAKIKAELAAEKGTLTPLIQTLHSARMGLRQTIQKSGVTENEVRGASAKVASAEADLAVERAKLYGRISPILTAQQLQRLNEMQQRADDLVDGAITLFGQRLNE